MVGFGNFIAYIINREIDLSNDLDKYSVEAMTKNGVFGNGNGFGFGEHLIMVKINFKEI